MKPVRSGFQGTPIDIALDRILPIRSPKPADNLFGKYKAVLSSVREIGIIEPLIVHPARGDAGHYVLLDGHLRLRALRELNQPTAWCLVSVDNDAYTHNHRVNRLSLIQEHAMIKRALEQGVTKDQIARALAIDISKVTAKVNLLDGIHPDAVELLKEKEITDKAFRQLKLARPLRQIEMAQLMVAANNYTGSYAEALIIGSRPQQLVEKGKPAVKGISAEEVARMEKELESVESDYKLAQEEFGENALRLNSAQRYVKKLLDNAKVRKFLEKRYPELLEECQDLASLGAL